MGFKASLAKAQQRIENMQARANQCGCAEGAAAMQASQMLSQIFSNMAYSMSYNYSTASTSSTSTKKTSVETEDVEVLGNGGAAEELEKELTIDEKKAAVKELLKDALPNIEKSEHFEELANKYGLYKKVHPEWTDEQIVTRLRMYRDALLSHDKQLIYSECLQRVTQEYMSTNNITEKDGLTPEQWTEIGQLCAAELKSKEMYSIDIDNCIRTEIEAKAKAGNENGLTPEYILSIQRRGQGYVELYDTDGNGKISKEEFIAFERKDNGDKLNEDEIKFTGYMFDSINNDDSRDGIDANEMASYLFGVSRAYDYGENNQTLKNTSDVIDFEEWFGSQNNVDDMNKIDEINKSMWNFLKNIK